MEWTSRLFTCGNQIESLLLARVPRSLKTISFLLLCSVSAVTGSHWVICASQVERHWGEKWKIINCNIFFLTSVFLKVNFEEDSRVKYLELLGYKKDDLRKKVSVSGSCACVKCFADGCVCRAQPEMFIVPCMVEVLIYLWDWKSNYQYPQAIQHNKYFYTTLFSVCFPADSICQWCSSPSSHNTTVSCDAGASF